MNKKVLGIVLCLVALIGSGYAMWSQKQHVLAAEVGNVEIEHELGTIRIPEHVEKIAVFDYATLDTLDSLGVSVTGTAKDSLPQYLAKYKTADYTDIGTLFEPNYEALAKMKPDVIFISGRQKEKYQALNEIAPTIYLAIDPADYIGSLQQNTALIGKVVNKEAEAARKISQISKEVEALKNKVAGQNPTGLILLANQEKFSAYGQASRFGIIHNAFGVRPIDTGIATSTHGQVVSYEYLVSQNPDYLFVIDRNKVVGGEDCRHMFENDLMEHTKAKQANHIVFLDPEVWYLASGGLQATSQMIAEIDAAMV